MTKKRATILIIIGIIAVITIGYYSAEKVFGVAWCGLENSCSCTISGTCNYDCDTGWTDYNETSSDGCEKCTRQIIQDVSCAATGSCDCQGPSCSTGADCAASGNTCGAGCPARAHATAVSNTCGSGYSHNCGCGEITPHECDDFEGDCNCTASGLCQYECNAGWEDADGVASNGCEECILVVGTCDRTISFNLVSCERSNGSIQIPSSDYYVWGSDLILDNFKVYFTGTNQNIWASSTHSIWLKNGGAMPATD